MQLDHKETKKNRIFAGLAILMGLVIMAIGFDIIPADPSSKHAPNWVIAVAGSAFVLAGIMIGGVGKLSLRANNFLGALLVTMLAIVPLWIGFGEGERQCTNTFLVTQEMRESSCRIVFGGMGLVLFVPLVIWAWSKFIKNSSK
ncbi:MAG TPA: hypothetical protein VD998_01755 [Verrucomicrobiae bacterium]|nr:hypothetical protein [Verrucomicrobiae bacterium]